MVRPPRLGILAGLERLGIERVHLVGHSGGGDVVVAIIESQPARVATATFLGTAPALRFVHLGGSARLMRRPWVGRLLWRLAGDGMIRNGLAKTFAPGFPAVPDVYVESLRQMSFQSYTSGFAQLEAFEQERDPSTRVAKAGVPLLVVFGEEDQWVSPHAVAHWRERTGARTVLLSGVEHTPMAEAPEATAAVILEHLRGAEAPPGRVTDRAT